MRRKFCNKLKYYLLDFQIWIQFLPRLLRLENFTDSLLILPEKKQNFILRIA